MTMKRPHTLPDLGLFTKALCNVEPLVELRDRHPDDGNGSIATRDAACGEHDRRRLYTRS